MRIFRPPDSLVRSVQNDEGRFYFSAAFDAILRKYGLILSGVHPATRAERGEFGFVARGTGWDNAFQSLPLVFEGPLAASVSAALRTSAHVYACEQLDIYDDGGKHLGMLRFNRVSLRRIPASRTQQSDPYPFHAEDSRWTPQRFEFHAFDPASTEQPVLWGVDSTGTCHLIGLRGTSHLVIGAPVFDLMVQHHVMPPYPDGYYARISASDLEPLERWLLTQAHALFRQSGCITAALGRWPHSMRACLTVRQDFDRPLHGDNPKIRQRRAEISRLLSCYADRGIKSTWFWRVASYNQDLVTQTITAGHEVGLHSEAFNYNQWSDELRFLRDTAQVSIDGYTAHGGVGAAGYLGQHQILWSLETRMVYGEMLGGNSTLPTRAIVIENEVPTVSLLILPGQHRGIDLTTQPDGHCLETLRPETHAALGAGQHCVIMHHPDIHVEQMMQLMDTLDLDGVWRATMREVANWALARNGVYRKDGTRSMSLTWGQPLPYSATLSIGHGDNAHSVVLPQGTRVAHVNLAEAQPRVVLSSNGSTSAAAIAIEPNTKQSMP